MTTEYTPLTKKQREQQNWYEKAYYWFWHDVCHRPEPFTYTMRRSAQEHPIYWIVIPAIIFPMVWLSFCWAAGIFKRVKTEKYWLWWIITPTVIGILFWLLMVHLWGIF